MMSNDNDDKISGENCAAVGQTVISQGAIRDGNI